MMFSYYFEILFGILSCVNLSESNDISVNITEYLQLPQLYRFDDVTKCFGEFPDRTSTYCFVDVSIVPDYNSNNWDFINTLSSNNRKYYRHDHLTRGICVHRCMERYKHVYNSTAVILSQSHQDSYLTRFHRSNFNASQENQIVYGDLLTQCINHELYLRYGLNANIEVVFCNTKKDESRRDIWANIFLIFMSVYFKVVTTSSFFDYRLKRKNAKEKDASNHYEVMPDGLKNQINACFSLQRNLLQLTKTSNFDEVKSINAVKFIVVTVIVIANTILTLYAVPIANPQYVEHGLKQGMTFLLSNTSTFIQIILMIYGFLLSYKMYQYKKENREFCRFFFVKELIYRYLRLLPIYLFIIALHSTCLELYRDGPILNYYSQLEQSVCRRNFWTNLLLVNNYVNVDEPCIQPTQFIATEFQLFILGSSLLLITWNFSKVKKIAITLVIVTGFLLPGIYSFVEQLDGTFMLHPESMRYFMWFDRTYNEILMPTHMNIAGYGVGIAAGIIWGYIHHKNIAMDSKKWFVILWWAVIPIFVIVTAVKFLYYIYEVPKFSIWMAFYTALDKIIWSSLAAIILIGISSGVGAPVRTFLNSKIFRPFGRMSFCIFMIHMFLLRITVIYIQTPIHLSNSKVIVCFSAALFLSYLCGFLLCILIELPFKNLQKFVIMKIRKEKPPKKCTEEIVENLDKGVQIEMNTNEKINGKE